MVKRLCKKLCNHTRSLVFDAVYLMRQQSKRRIKPNLTQIFIDFYDEHLEVGKYVPRNMIILSPDALKMNQKHFN